MMTIMSIIEREMTILILQLVTRTIAAIVVIATIEYFYDLKKSRNYRVDV
jgi:hypothetical protein